MNRYLNSALPAWAVAALLLLAGCGERPDRAATNAAPASASAPAASVTNAAPDAAAASTNAAPDEADACAASDEDGEDGEAAAPAPAAKTPAPVPVQVRMFSAEPGGDEIKIEFNGAPDVMQFRDYVRTEPEVRLTVRPHSWDREQVVVSGPFARNREYTFIIKAGAPMRGGRKLETEYRRPVTFGDRTPRVSYAAGGRYLPPAGLRAVAVDTVNVRKLEVTLARVPAQNIVQLLAREERRYDNWYGDVESDNTLELAEKPFAREIVLDGARNETRAEPVRLLTPAEDGAGRLEQAPNGVYLMAARDADELPDDPSWDERASRRPVYRLVCATDIGLSVRQAGDWIYAWATSLSTGRPEPGIRVSVYGANGVLIAEDGAGADGLAACDCSGDRGERGEPFAVVAARADGSDCAFLALAPGVEVDETVNHPGMRAFVAPEACEAYLWTDRGIYRHGEPVMAQAVLRDGAGSAPAPFPVTLRLFDPTGREYAHATGLPDAFGRFTVDDFSVPADQRSGRWRVAATVPDGAGGRDFREIGDVVFTIEEFVPPKVRVTLADLPEGAADATNLSASVSAEHLFGGAARGLAVEAAVSFADAPFAPAEWKGYAFGTCARSIAPNFRRLPRQTLDADGRATFAFAPEEPLTPAAAVKLTVQGSVFENGGRPATARRSSIIHLYPFYVGVALDGSVKRTPGGVKRAVALVNPDGSRHAGRVKLNVRFERIESNYTCTRGSDGFYTWKCEKLNYPIAEETVETDEQGAAEITCPADGWGEIAAYVEDPASGAAFGATYFVSWDGSGDDTVRAPMNDPTALSLVPDKDVYLPGEIPQITVKAPFAGRAWITAMREGVIWSQVVSLTNATSVVKLDAVEADWAPSADVAVTVVQAVGPGAKHRAARARGVTPIRVTTADRKLDVSVSAAVAHTPAGARVTAEVSATGAAPGEVATVTVVDEGINLFTDQPVPDPYAWFAEIRTARHPLYDIFNRLLPVLGDPLKANGAKTGGGADEGLFSRVSPVPTRRFKPLSKWVRDVPLTDGKGSQTFDLGEFVGEVRVTAVAANRRGVGAAAVQAKVAPKLVAQPDAPRFAAPGDRVTLTYTLSNRSGEAGEAAYAVAAPGTNFTGAVKLEKDGSATLEFPLALGMSFGEEKIVYTAKGFGESHTEEILLPVRPAVPWEKTGATFMLRAGEERTFELPAEAPFKSAAVRAFTVRGDPFAELAEALSYLTHYPHGCLEQTTSQVFPLVAAGGILGTLDVERTTVAADAKEAVAAGVARVGSMIRAEGFAMWPDVNTQPADARVQPYAAEFLLEAAAAGFAVPAGVLEAVKGFARDWAGSSRLETAAYGCLDLALAGAPNRARMLDLCDSAKELSSVDRARLARAFALAGDRDRARALLADARPASGPLALAETLSALCAIDREDARIPGFVTALLKARDPKRGHWLTTADNARALLALADYYRAAGLAGSAAAPDVAFAADGRESALAPNRRRAVKGGGPVKVVNRGGPAYLSVEQLVLPDPARAGAVTNGASVSVRVLSADEEPVDPDTLRRGDSAILEVQVDLAEESDFADFVIDVPLPACFEPGTLTPEMRAACAEYELRRDVRDDRVTIFSKAQTRYPWERDKPIPTSFTFCVPVSVVTMGDFTFPGASVDAMYIPEINARSAAGRIAIAR